VIILFEMEVKCASSMRASKWSVRKAAPKRTSEVEVMEQEISKVPSADT
jgi:hypothetical protein